MHLSLPRTLLLIAALSLGACGQHVGRMEFIAPIQGDVPAQFSQAISIGEISGGSSSLNPVGVTNDEFRQVLEYALRTSGLLTPKPEAGHYRLDARLSFMPAPNATLDDQRTDLTVRYRLFEAALDSPTLERTIHTAYVQPAPGAGAEIGVLLFSGIGGLINESQFRSELSYEGTVRGNLQQFLYELAAFGKPAAPKVATVAPSPAAQPVPVDPLATTAKPTPPPPAQQPAALTARAAPAPPPAPAAPTPVLFGDQVDFRCPAAGTEIDFRSGLTRVFAPPPTGTLDCPYRSGDTTAEATIFGRYDAKSEAALQGLWPLRVGNAVSFVSGGSMERLYNETYRVTGHERITVPAGTFDAFVIEWDASSNNIYALNYHETARFWYAPAVGFVVKVEHHLEGGFYARLIDDEAVRITAQ